MHAGIGSGHKIYIKLPSICQVTLSRYFLTIKMSMNIPFIYLHPSWLQHTSIPCWVTPMSPYVITSLNLRMPQSSKAKSRRRWPWPLTCDLCHPHTSNPTPSLSTDWLRMVCSLPGVSYYTLTHADSTNLWKLWHVCTNCGGWVMCIHFIKLKLHVL